MPQGERGGILRNEAESELEACQTIRRRKIYRRTAALLPSNPQPKKTRRQFGWKKVGVWAVATTPLYGPTGTLPTFLSSKQFKRPNDKLLENYVHKKAKDGIDCGTSTTFLVPEIYV